MGDDTHDTDGSTHSGNCDSRKERQTTITVDKSVKDSYAQLKRADDSWSDLLLRVVEAHESHESVCNCECESVDYARIEEIVEQRVASALRDYSGGAY